MATYLTYPLLEVRPQFSLSGGCHDEFVLVGNELVKRSKFDFSPLNDVLSNITFVCRTAAEMYAVRNHFQTVLGRYGAFWIPSWNNDYQRSAPVLSGATSFPLVGDYAQLGYQISTADIVRHVYIPSSGQAAKVLSILDNVITLGTALTQNLAATSHICNLYLGRMNSDSLRIEKAAGMWKLQFDFIELQPETP